jgi:hypothetical protein
MLLEDRPVHHFDQTNPARAHHNFDLGSGLYFVDLNVVDSALVGSEDGVGEIQAPEPLAIYLKFGLEDGEVVEFEDEIAEFVTELWVVGQSAVVVAAQSAVAVVGQSVAVVGQSVVVAVQSVVAVG